MVEIYIVSQRDTDMLSLFITGLLLVIYLQM
jgi:hypothetical protein